MNSLNPLPFIFPLDLQQNIQYYGKLGKPSRKAKGQSFLPGDMQEREVTMKLTDRQKVFLDYIARYMDEWGQSPSFKEICSHFGFGSYNTVTTYLKILERKGYIQLPRKKNQKRAIEVISPVETRRFEFPLLGRVAAGKPIEAVENVDVIEVPPSMAGTGEHFVLQVNGNSMMEDGILDGDFVVIRKQPTAENGETVVALINNEATVKKYYKRKNHVELHPAHRDLKPIIVRNQDLRIEGKVVGVMRYYK
jgi:repressor LexA